MNMETVTVRCRCGRDMRVDALHGAGAFKCGCGVAVVVTMPHLVQDFTKCSVRTKAHQCTAERHAKLPVCKGHAALIAKSVLGEEELKSALNEDEIRQRVREVENDQLRRQALQSGVNSERKSKRREELAGRAVVYYARVHSGEIKVGTTVNVTERMNALRVRGEALLAAEPGGMDLEKMRHAQFKSLRLHHQREDFRADEELMSHIRMIRGHHGDPWGLQAALVAEGAPSTVASA